MEKHRMVAASMVAACMAMAPLAMAGDASDAQVYTFQVDVDAKGAMVSVQPVGTRDATAAQLQRELVGWLFERPAGHAVTTFVRVSAIAAGEGTAPRILSASAGPAPDALSRPAYPESARRVGRQGVVVLALSTDANGAVQDVAVHDTVGQVDRAMANAALAAARQWSFHPERIGGTPQAGKLLMPVCFTVNASSACNWTGPNDQAFGRDSMVALSPAARLASPARYALK